MLISLSMIPNIASSYGIIPYYPFVNKISSAYYYSSNIWHTLNFSKHLLLNAAKSYGSSHAQINNRRGDLVSLLAVC